MFVVVLGLAGDRPGVRPCSGHCGQHTGQDWHLLRRKLSMSWCSAEFSLELAF